MGSLACVIAASGILNLSFPLMAQERNLSLKNQSFYHKIYGFPHDRKFLQLESDRTLIRGLVLLNCSGGMNNKAIVDDWRIKLLFPLLLLIDFLLKQRGIASAIFKRVKERYHL